MVDIADFTRPDRTEAHQSVMQEGLYRVLQDAFADVGVDWDACVVEDRGDGAMMLMPPGVSNGRLADWLPGRVVAGLRRHNAVHSPEARIQLRVGLHAGEVSQNDRGVVSQAVNLAFRILNAPQAKSALRSSAGVLALIVSDAFYHDVIVQEPAADPGSYRRILVPDRETLIEAWLCLPDHRAPEVRDDVVQVLMEAGLAEDTQSRSHLTQAISNYLGRPLTVPSHLVGTDYLVELVNACTSIEGGAAALARAVWLVRPESSEYHRISQLLGLPRVRELLPGSELQRLREWLVQITTIPHLWALVHQAAPGLLPAPSLANAWEAFAHLVEFNAGADGLPPAVMFVDLLVGQVTGEMSTRLTGWVNDQACRLRLEGALEACRKRREAVVPRIAVSSRLHLVIVVRHDGIDPSRYLLSYWRQDDPAEWPPACGETRLVMLDELERRVDEVVVGAERAWAAGQVGCSVALEFVLPRALLNLPLHRWCKEYDSGIPSLLYLDYPVVIRSLERMESLHWHRMWHQRWQALMRDPSTERVYVRQPTDSEQPYRLHATLRDPRWALMVLTEPPPSQPQSAADELTTALRAGLPALIWHPEASPEALREIVTRLAEGDGLSDLPGRMQTLRQAAFQAAAAPSEGDIACDLVVLWDDPYRLVTFDQPVGQPPDEPHPGGDIVDERERVP